ncbi:MAG: hypothetical protein JWO03_1447 [Bacteroidetes bacterium]|nr:hypothetical protein [Bacteroidota bacterium]
MMRVLTLFIFCLCLSMSIHAQSNSSNPDEAKRWKPGFIITLHDDTVYGKIKSLQFLDTYYDYQRKVAFEHEGVISEYLPVDIKLFSFDDLAEKNREQITLEAVSDPREGGGHIFSRILCNGACRVYAYTITLTRESESMMSTGKAIAPSLLATEKKYLQLGRSEFFPLKMIGFKKIMKEIFVMCPVILARLENKQYTYDNWKALVQDYNCGICK